MSSRREFISLLGGAAVAWPLAARAQQPERMRRIGVLFASLDEGYVPALAQELTQLGWSEGRRQMRRLTGFAFNLGQAAGGRRSRA